MKREIEEELWVTPTFISDFPVRFYTYNRSKAVNYPRVANIYYEVRIDDKNLILEEGYIDYKYFDLASLEELDTWIDMRELFTSLK